MYQSVNFSDFVDAFHAHDRYEQFGYQALRVIFDYLEQLEEDTGEKIELDVIAICCEYSADTPEDIASNYGIDIEDSDDIAQTVIDYLQEHTSVCGQTDDGQIVYAVF